MILASSLCSVDKHTTIELSILGHFMLGRLWEAARILIWGKTSAEIRFCSAESRARMLIVELDATFNRINSAIARQAKEQAKATQEAFQVPARPRLENPRSRVKAHKADLRRQAFGNGAPQSPVTPDVERAEVEGTD